MKGEKDLSMSVLFDFYAPLLTDKQREAVDLYYNEDLSLAEIAEQWQISRQGVREQIKRGEQVMTEAEEKLHIAARSSEIDRLCSLLNENAKHIRDEDLRKEITEISAAIGNVM